MRDPNQIREATFVTRGRRAPFAVRMIMGGMQGGLGARAARRTQSIDLYQAVVRRSQPRMRATPALAESTLWCKLAAGDVFFSPAGESNTPRRQAARARRNATKNIAYGKFNIAYGKFASQCAILIKFVC